LSRNYLLPPTFALSASSIPSSFRKHQFIFISTIVIVFTSYHPTKIFHLLSTVFPFPPKMRKDIAAVIASPTFGTEQAQAKPSKAKEGKRSRMKQRRIPADDFRSIMETNAHFYSAFSSLDMSDMESLWLNDKRCICHFPGMKKLVGYENIMKSWKHAVKKMDGVSRRNWMEPSEIQIEFQTSEKATVFCKESVYSISCTIVKGELQPKSELIETLSATNAFKKENGKWKLWYHQASSMSDNPAGLWVLPTKEKLGKDANGLAEEMIRNAPNAVATDQLDAIQYSNQSSLTMQTFEQRSTNTSDPFRALDSPVVKNAAEQ